MRSISVYNLRDLLESLVAQEPGITELYIFGSRAYGTGSLRSDCDVLVNVDPKTQVKASDLRDFALMNCPALDLFLCTDVRAVSVANDSFVYAPSLATLLTKLDAKQLWTRVSGFSDFAFSSSGSWDFKTSALANFAATVLPDDTIEEFSWPSIIKRVEPLGLPIRPFIGDTLVKATTQIIEVSRRMILRANQVGQRGSAKDGWTVNLKSEYDCQDLFFTIVKPWLPGLTREDVAISFDGQDKRSDFSLFGGKLIIEMKFIASEAKKAEVVKTLDGLSIFYRRNANVGALLFIIFVKENVQLDARLWESNYSFLTTLPTVTTVVIPIP